MGEPTPPFGGGDIWNDVPLFREIQRVLLSSSGPVNWELARQVGIATASSSGEDPHPGAEDLRGVEGGGRPAELQGAGVTRLDTPPRPRRGPRPRGRASLRVREAVGAGALPGSARRLHVDDAPGRGGSARAPVLARSLEPRGDAS